MPVQRSPGPRPWSRRSYPLSGPSPYSRDRSMAHRTHRPLAQHGLLIRVCKRYYGLMRRSPVLRVASPRSYSTRSLSGRDRTGHLPFFALTPSPHLPPPLPRRGTDFVWWLIRRSWEPSSIRLGLGDPEPPTNWFKWVNFRGSSDPLMLRPVRWLGLLTSPRPPQKADRRARLQPSLPTLGLPAVSRL